MIGITYPYKTFVRVEVEQFLHITTIPLLQHYRGYTHTTNGNWSGSSKSQLDFGEAKTIAQRPLTCSTLDLDTNLWTIGTMSRKRGFGSTEVEDFSSVTMVPLLQRSK